MARTGIWLLVRQGREEEAREMVGKEDTADLFVLKRDAMRMIEYVMDELDGREGSANFPARGMDSEATPYPRSPLRSAEPVPEAERRTAAELGISPAGDPFAARGLETAEDAAYEAILDDVLEDG